MSKRHRRQRRRVSCSTTRRSIEKKIRSAVTDTGREVVFDPEDKPGVSNLLDDPRRRSAASSVDDLRGRAIAGSRLRRPEEGPSSRRVVDLGDAVPAIACSEYLDDPAELDASSRTAPSGPARSRPTTLADVYDRVGFLPAAERR